MCLKCIFPHNYQNIHSHLKQPPSPIVKDRWGGSGEGQGRKGLPAQCLTMVQDRTNKSWSKRCLRYMAMVKNQTQPLWVHCSDAKKKKKSSSQIYRNTRLQLVRYYYFVKFFCLFLQGLATLLHFLSALQQLREVGIKHEKVSR